MTPRAPEDHADAERFLLSLARFNSAVVASMADATDEPEFVTNTPVLVLCLLDLEGPERPGAIGDLVGLTSGGTTKLLDRMENAGLIKRSYGAIDTDHRGVQVALTAKGHGVVRAATGALVAHLPGAVDFVKEITSLVESIAAADT